MNARIDQVVKALILLTAIAATGCHSGGAREPAPLPASLDLHQAITIPAERTAVFMQAGRVQSFSELNAYAPHCKFELRALSSNTRTVAPERFTIVRVRDEINVAALAAPLHVAALWLASTEQPTYWVYATAMDLHSASQPEVFRLTCQHWEPGDASFPRHLTVGEMRDALGAVASLN